MYSTVSLLNLHHVAFPSFKIYKFGKKEERRRNQEKED